MFVAFSTECIFGVGCSFFTTYPLRLWFLRFILGISVEHQCNSTSRSRCKILLDTDFSSGSQTNRLLSSSYTFQSLAQSRWCYSTSAFCNETRSWKRIKIDFLTSKFWVRTISWHQKSRTRRAHLVTRFRWQERKLFHLKSFYLLFEETEKLFEELFFEKENFQKFQSK